MDLISSRNETGSGFGFGFGFGVGGFFEDDVLVFFFWKSKDMERDEIGLGGVGQMGKVG